MHDGVLECMYSIFILFFPDERCAFMYEVNEWVGNSRVVFDPDMHVASDAEKSLDV